MRLLTAATALFIGSMMTPTDALACSCAGGLVYSLPQWGAKDVPLNPTIRLGYVSEPASDGFTLVGEDGQTYAVDIQRRQVVSTEEVTLTPVDLALLAPNTHYQLMGGGSLILEFTTGEAADSEAPGFGGITDFSGGYDDGCTPTAGGGMQCDTCGPSTNLRIEYAPSSDNMTAPEDLLYRVYVEVGGATPTQESYNYVSRGWGVGQFACSSTYLGLEVGDTVTIRASVIDAAGLESPLGEAVSTVVEDDPDNQSGCAASRSEDDDAPLPGLLLFGVAGLTAMGIRRRR